MNYYNIKISEETLVEMLVNRVSYWTDNFLEQELFKKYYENNIDWISQVDDTGEFSVNYIVDNDFVGNFTIREGVIQELEEWEKKNIIETIENKVDNTTLFLIATH